MKEYVLKWWKEIDKTIFILSLVLLVIGIILSLTGTTEIREQDSTFYIKRHLIFVFLSIVFLTFFSLQSTKFIRRISLAGLIISLALMCLIHILGYEINGAKRWLPIYGFTIQPSEFLKPFFVVMSGWFLIKGIEGKKFGLKIVFILFLFSSCLLILQPDFGMTILFMVVFFCQLFVAGLSIFLVIVLGLILLLIGIISYYKIEHVKKRVDIFLDPTSGDTFQIEQSIKAFKSGGITGKGLGQGILKEKIPDAHTDFIFAIAGEELGFIFCSILIFIFLYIIIRSLLIILKKRDPYCLIVVVGLISIFGLQSIINIASVLGAIPTKGITLPLISYGGSSMLSSSILIGILLSHIRNIKKKNE